MKRKIPNVLIASEQEAILNQFPSRPYKPGTPGRPTSTLRQLRDLCLIRLMLNSGLRCSEVLKLRRRDVELTTGRLWVRNGKGGKDRVLWLADDDVALLTAYLDAQGGDYQSDEIVFRSLDNGPGKGGPLGGRYVRSMLVRVAKAAGIQKAVHPHTLRHTFATDLLKATKNLRLVQKALGHARVETTTIYTHIVDDELEDALKNFRR